MNLLETLKMALRGISVNKVRSALTMLGIVIGVGAVVAMVSIGTGATSSVTSRIQGLGSNLLTIMAGAPSVGGVRQAMGSATSLTIEDAEALKKSVSTVKNVSPELSQNAQVVYLSQNTNTSISGVMPAYEEVRNFHAAYGQFITKDDVDTSRRVAVLGQTVAGQLFSAGEEPIGKVIKINNIPFQVIGIMEQKGSGGGSSNMDDTILIPLSTAMHRVFGSRSLRQISVEVASADQMDQASAEITNLLMIRHKISDSSKIDFQIMNQAEVLNTLSEVTGTLTLLLGGIAAISLIVGGIGIMNIMLVSVTERTREIGLRKAVGAKRRDVLFQFLIESVLLCLAGGVAGVGLGFLGSVAIGQYAGWGTVISISSIWLAFFFSGAVGVFFGIYPAIKASRLNPIDALRYE
ncbi:MAG: ABC transporter permease [Actinobacteria bacterium]|nr:ABC transporter permease [Actinomycetota bacterium]